MSDNFYLILVWVVYGLCICVCVFVWVLAVVILLSLKVEAIHPVKMAGSAQEEETFCHKHISLCLNTDDTEVPITHPAAVRVRRVLDVC